MRFFAFSLVIVLLASGRAVAHAEPLTIKRVATWEELLKQPVIDIGDGVKVRLGIESLECPKWSGVALYAYTEGFNDRKRRFINPDALGPVWVSVRFGDVSFDGKYKSAYLPRWEWETGDKQPRLFCRFLMVDRVGDYQVNVRTEKGKDLARVTVKGTDAPFHPWSTLLLTENTQYEQVGDLHKFRRIAPAKATYAGKGIALPNMESAFGYSANGWHPWGKAKGIMPDLPFPFGKGPLPKVLPQTIDPKLELKFVQDKMLVRIISKDRIDRPGSHLLCRWWVNGKPFVPEQVDPIPEKGDGSLGALDEEEDLQIELKIAPKTLKAKSGDQIELQLLYCPTGWLAVKNPQTIMKGYAAGYPRLTNKVSFKLP